MSVDIPYLGRTLDAIRDVMSLVKQALAVGEAQATTRDGAIQTIDEMVDSLEHASDLIMERMSASITEFYRIRGENERVIRAYFERRATAFSEPSLRALLHQAGVYSDLHKLGDRFETPISPESLGGLSVWQNLRTLFTRSNTMSGYLHGLLEGELDYLRDFSTFLDDVRDRAEAATQLYVEQDMRQGGEELIDLMRRKRRALSAKMTEVREAADRAIEALH